MNLQFILLISILVAVSEGIWPFRRRGLFKSVRKPRYLHIKRSWTPYVPRYQPRPYGYRPPPQDDSDEIFGGFQQNSYGVGASINVASGSSETADSVETISGTYGAPSPSYGSPSNSIVEGKPIKRDIEHTLGDSYESIDTFFGGRDEDGGRVERGTRDDNMFRSSDSSSEAYNVINYFKTLPGASNNFFSSNFDSNDNTNDANNVRGSRGFFNANQVEFRDLGRRAKDKTTLNSKTVKHIPPRFERASISKMILDDEPFRREVPEFHQPTRSLEMIEEDIIDEEEYQPSVLEILQPEEPETARIDNDSSDISTQLAREYQKGWNIVNLLRELVTTKQ